MNSDLQSLKQGIEIIRQRSLEESCCLVVHLVFVNVCVIPTEVGIHSGVRYPSWIPVCTGMTGQPTASIANLEIRNALSSVVEALIERYYFNRL